MSDSKSIGLKLVLSRASIDIHGEYEIDWREQ